MNSTNRMNRIIAALFAVLMTSLTLTLAIAPAVNTPRYVDAPAGLQVVELPTVVITSSHRG